MTAQSHLQDAFLVALLLAGAAEAAERAVSKAIALSGSVASSHKLLVESADCAIQLSSGFHSVPPGLPPELARLFQLSSAHRNCFVLRMLAGLSSEVTSGILKLRADQVDDGLCAALTNLARLSANKSTVGADAIPSRQTFDSDSEPCQRRSSGDPEVSRR